MGRIAAVPTPISTPAREEIGAEFLELDRRIQDFAPTAKRYKVVQDLIRGWYADEPAEQACVFEGKHYRIHIGARGEERFFSLKSKIKIFTKLGKVKALALFSFTLKAVEEALGKGELDLLVSTSPTGSRKLVAVAKAQIERAA